MTAEELFESVGFVKEYYEQMADFYKNNFKSEEEMISFFVKVFQNDEKDKTPRRMMNQIQRLVSIANDIDQIRPGRDSLRIFFVKTCMEALCALSGMNNKESKPIFYNTFPSCMNDEGKAYILDNFSLLNFEDGYMNHQYEASYELTIDDFFEIIKAVRDSVAHEGNYWEMQFFAHDSDSTWITSLETDRQILKSYEYQNKKKITRTYVFETTMQYDQFIYYFVEASVNFVLGYIERKAAEKNE